MCQEDGGDLVVIQSENETLIVQELLKEESVTQAWIGLQELFTSWKWISGQYLVSQTPQYFLRVCGHS